MKKRIIKLILAIMAILISLFLVKSENIFFNGHERENSAMSDEELILLGDIYVIVPADENKGIPRDIYSFSSEDGKELYVVVPSNIDITSLSYYVVTSWDECACRKTSDFSNGRGASIGTKVLHVIQPNLPFLFLEAKEEDYSLFEKKIYEEFDKDILLDIDMFMYGSGMGVNALEAKGTIHLRGNGTSVGPTKPYSLKLDKAYPLLNMPQNKKWNLLANWQDKTLLKNKVFLNLARKMNIEYSPYIENVNLFINGDYKGVYSLTTKVKANENCINLNDGDFLICWSDTVDSNFVGYDSETWFNVCEKDDFVKRVEVVYPEDSSANDLISSKVQKIVDILEKKSSEELADYIDMDSFARFYWLQEASMNFDGGVSIYSYYLGKTDKLYMGPAWDMDLTLGSVEGKYGINFDDPYGWKIRNTGFWKVFFENKEFVNTVNDIYFSENMHELFADSLSYFREEAVKYEIDGEMNFIKRFDEMETYGIHYDVQNYYEQVDQVTNIYEERIAWIDEQMNE